MYILNIFTMIEKNRLIQLDCQAYISIKLMSRNEKPEVQKQS